MADRRDYKNRCAQMKRIPIRNLTVLAALAAAVCCAYLLFRAYPENPVLFGYILSLRIPALAAMVLAAAAIGSATIVFQTVINNRIVTPCLLGMNSLYTLIHTAVVFAAGSGSILAVNSNLSFAVDLLVMGVSAAFVYSYMFRKTGNNVLYVMLIGTVISSFFSSVQSALIRVMDPNEYDVLLTSLVADFNHVNGEVILFGAGLLALLAVFLRKDLKLLDVIILGKAQSVNLGVDYDRTVRRLLLGVVLCIAVATAMVGPVSFLGLIIANLSRQLLKTHRHSFLIPGAVFMGIMAVIAGQLISQHLFSYGVPVSTFVTIGGGIYFLYLLLKKGEL